jgi:hypothetical protein
MEELIENAQNSPEPDFLLDTCGLDLVPHFVPHFIDAHGMVSTGAKDVLDREAMKGVTVCDEGLHARRQTCAKMSNLPALYVRVRSADVQTPEHRYRPTQLCCGKPGTGGDGAACCKAFRTAAQSASPLTGL